ncbi:hypothetical protein V8C34DRAFT_318119 [Trichoderma compactum]
MANEPFTVRAVVDHNVSLAHKDKSPAQKATMMCMKCNNVAFVPLFALFLVLGCKSRCRWLKAMPDPALWKCLRATTLLLALTKEYHSAACSALPRRILPLPLESPTKHMPRPRKSFSGQRCDASSRRQRKTVPYAGRSRRLERSLSRLSRTTEESVVQGAFTCCHGLEGFWPIVNDGPGRG